MVPYYWACATENNCRGMVLIFLCILRYVDFPKTVFSRNHNSESKSYFPPNMKKEEMEAPELKNKMMFSDQWNTEEMISKGWTITIINTASITTMLNYKNDTLSVLSRFKPIRHWMDSHERSYKLPGSNII